MSKRFLSLVLALVMVLGTLGTTVFAEGSGNEKIDKLVELGLVKGREDGDLALTESIRRDEVAAMVVRAMDLETVAEAMKYTPTKFKDVKVGEWNNGYVAVAEGEGITKGVSANEFAPARDITYAEVAAMMVRVLGAMTAEEEKVASWPATYIAKAEKLGIFKDVEMTATNAVAKRQQVFEMVFNTITQKGSNLVVANTVEGIVIENYRTENIGKDEIIVHVMKDQVQKTGNKYYEAGDEFNITIDKELKAKGYDVETLLGKVVTVSFDKADKVVDIKVNNDYQYVEGKLAKADSKEIRLGGKYYTVNKEEAVRTTDANKDNRLYQAYFNNRDYHYDRFISEISGAEYAKATVRNGKVLFVEAFDFVDVAPVAKDITDKNVVAYYDDYRDGEVRELTIKDSAYVINFEKNERTEKYEMTLGNNKEIKANDVIHYFTDYKGNLTVFVRAEADNKVEGVYKEANAAKAKEDADIVIVVDGEEYPALIDSDYRKPVYSTLMNDGEFLALTDDYDWDLEPFEKKEVVVLRDMFGYVQSIGTQTVDGRFYAVVSDLMNYDFTLVRDNEDGYKGKGSDYKVSLRGTTFLVDSDKMDGTKEQQLAKFDVKDLVLVTAEEGEISVLDERTQKSKVITELNKDAIEFEGGEWNYISNKVILFDVVGAPKATTVKEINDNYFYKDHPEVKGYIVENEKGLATVIVITEGESKDDKTLSTGNIVEVTRVRMRSNKYYLTVETADGKETTHLVKGKDAHNLVADTTVEAGAVVELFFLKGEKIEDEPAIQEINVIFPPFETYEIVQLGRADAKGERLIKLQGKNGKDDVATKWISRNAYVFGNIGVDKVVAVREMAKYDRLDIVYVTGGDVTGTWAVPVDKADLAAAITEALEIDTTLYTPETVQALQAAITAAQTVNGKADATQEEVNEALEALEAAVEELVLKPAATVNVTYNSLGFGPSTIFEVTVNSVEEVTVDSVKIEGQEASFEIGAKMTTSVVGDSVTVSLYNGEELVGTIILAGVQEETTANYPIVLK